MSVEVVLDSPLAHALNASIQPKLVEVGWSTGGADDSALSEYIILMLVNGKTQEQIAAELSGDLLNLGDDDPGARDFSQWLFNQVGLLNSQISGGGYPETGAETEQGQFGDSNVSQDADMNDASEAGDINVPTGPKSMRNGSGGISRPRDKRMLNHLTKAMDRTHDAALHRVRPQSGNERINTHARGPPTGPRGPVNIRGSARMQNGRGHGGMGGMPTQHGAAQNIMSMSQQQQLELCTTYYVPLTIYHLPLTTHHSPLTTHHSPYYTTHFVHYILQLNQLGTQFGLKKLWSALWSHVLPTKRYLQGASSGTRPPSESGGTATCTSTDRADLINNSNLSSYRYLSISSSDNGDLSHQDTERLLRT